jgi:hypothetical protein
MKLLDKKDEEELRSLHPLIKATRRFYFENKESVVNKDE